ncbi:hypothetical protein HYW75_04170 [Candidatus Pacearchaeota archaeon]|nr:hypothetical protein [Candidatus Pacearchaeota archaeon]
MLYEKTYSPESSKGKIKTPFTFFPTDVYVSDESFQLALNIIKNEYRENCIVHRGLSSGENRIYLINGGVVEVLDGGRKNLSEKALRLKHENKNGLERLAIQFQLFSSFN